LFRHLPKPFHARVLVNRVRLAGSDINLSCDGLVDDGLFLFLQQRDQLLLGTDVAPDALVNVVEEPNDASLLRKRWNADFKCRQRGLVNGRIGDADRLCRDAIGERIALTETTYESRKFLRSRSLHRKPG